MRQKKRLIHELTGNSGWSEKKKIANCGKGPDSDGSTRTIRNAESGLNEKMNEVKQNGQSYSSWWRLLMSSVTDLSELIENELIIGVSKDN